MNYLAELKQFARLHAVAQNIKEAQFSKILAGIDNADGDEEGSWAYEFSRIGDALVSANKWIEAIKFYNLAQFPYLNNVQRIEASKKSRSAFRQWNQYNKCAFEFITCVLNGKTIPFYFYRAKKKISPLLIVIGGIVSTKEQWSGFLNLAKKLDLTTAVIEMPGVGENKSVYYEESFNLFGAVIETIKKLAVISDVHIVAMSFGGTLAMKYAVRDRRIKSLFNVGAPIYHFFIDEDIFNKIPTVTKKILHALCGAETNKTFDSIKKLHVTTKDLALLNIPVNYIASLKDEIIPAKERILLQENVKQLRLYQFNDVHGSPYHMPQIRRLITSHILKICGKYKLLRYFLDQVNKPYLVNN